MPEQQDDICQNFQDCLTESIPVDQEGISPKDLMAFVDLLPCY